MTLPVAFVGLGRMGAPMAANLVAAGFDLVVQNRTRSVAEGVAAATGATVADTPREAAAGAGVVITMLSTPDVLRAVLTGPDGVLAGLEPGAVVLDMGTTGPAAVEELAPEVAAAGGVLVDAPVSGSVAAAESAQLAVMVGAPADAFAVVEPVLRAMARSVHHLGDTGSGSVAKLAVNDVVFAIGNAVAEALVLAERAGLDRAAMYDVFEDSAVAAPMVGYRRDAFLDPDGTPAAFAMTLMAKDLRLVQELAERLDLPMEQAAANLALAERAIAAGLGERDMADVAVLLRGLGRDDG